MTCDVLAVTAPGQFAGVCRSPGPQAVGDPCVTADCVAGAHCTPGPAGTPAICRALCDAAHPCPGGGTCIAYSGLSDGAGWCP
jgi:hypothetical protein